MFYNIPTSFTIYANSNKGIFTIAIADYYLKFL
ncbi:hypothetical protein SAMN04489722_10958 [Algibacter lectus]|uniref:Uncharacterized protein n=1 Tax=Algibacter lectus TaxID=221126 RepID=A0A4R8M487_9FLAO|nr:hypothetical protein DFQ06_3654 [Algibacter lectus]SFD41464.1 hypothetical protein SAMN04489722_10958 [Algibacter lectus]